MPVPFGQPVRLTGQVTQDGSPVTPASATVTVKLPTGVVAPPVTVSPASPLVYDYAPTMAGPHWYRFDTTGPVAAIPGMFDVRGQFPGYLVSLTDAKDALGIASSVTKYDSRLLELLEAVTGAVEFHTSRAIAVRTEVYTRRLDAGTKSVFLDPHPVVSLTSIATTDALLTWNVADMDLDGDTGKLTVRTGNTLSGEVRFTFVAGMSVLPARYTRASKLILKSQWQAERGTTSLTSAPGALEDTVQVPGLQYPIPKLALALLGDRPPVFA